MLNAHTRDGLLWSLFRASGSGVFPIVLFPPDAALSRWPRLSVGFFETESPSLPFKKVGTNTMIIMASLPTPLDSIFYVQTINYFSEFVKRFFNFFSRSNSVWNMSASLTRIARQVSQMFDLNRRNLVQYSPLKHFFKIRVQIVLTFRIFRVYYYT